VSSGLQALLKLRDALADRLPLRGVGVDDGVFAKFGVFFGHA
jgi:hypothetical protein